MRWVSGAVLFLAASLAAAADPAPPDSVPSVPAPPSLLPTKSWFAPSQPLNIQVKPGGPASLVLTDFRGRVLDARQSTDVAGDSTVNLNDYFVALQTANTYVLYLVKKQPTPEELAEQKASVEAIAAARAAALVKDRTPADFIGTPLVISVREDRRRGAPPGPMVVRVEPLSYAVMQTAHGPVMMGFYYDIAPHTVENFLDLARQGFYDGLTFHRISPNFVIQGGDPRGDGTGGPGYMIDAEFSDAKDSGRVHDAGSLSMARTGDPGEAPGVMPRPEFANSGGSQFFICLNYENTRTLDGRYTLFGKVTGGMEAVNKIAQAPLADDRSEKPREPQVIQRVQVMPVTKEHNPYAQLMKAREAAAELRPAQPAK